MSKDYDKFVGAEIVKIFKPRDQYFQQGVELIYIKLKDGTFACISLIVEWDHFYMDISKTREENVELEEEAIKEYKEEFWD